MQCFKLSVLKVPYFKRGQKRNTGCIWKSSFLKSIYFYIDFGWSNSKYYLHFKKNQQHSNQKAKFYKK